MRRKTNRISLFIAIFISLLSCQQIKINFPDKINTGIIPKPILTDVHEEVFQFDNGWTIDAPQELNSAKEALLEFLEARCDLVLAPASISKIIQLEINNDSDFGLEGFKLNIQNDKIQLSANDINGIQRGIASLEQLILLNEFEGHYFLPSLNIVDHAAFPHRGLLLDCCRHFFSVDIVKKYIDLLALFKMNTLHWHITEDQGWRIAIDKYPKLTETGAYRIEADGSRYGGFYTKDQIRDIVAYASERQINIIPEIELPGHAQAAIASYPHLSCTGKSVPVANDWGVFKEIYCAGNDSVFIFLEHVLTEVMELFPSRQIHIGGDEAPKVRWEKCSKCQKRIQDEGLADEHELQSYFVKRIQAFLNENGRELIGWDEILEGGLAEGATVQSWRGTEGGTEAVKSGNRAIMSPTSHAYLDYGLDAIDLEKVYGFNPIPDGLTEEEAKLIIGGECNMWTEHVPNEKVLDSKVFPRMLAMAEVLWSPSSDRDYIEFKQRVQDIYPLLEKLGVHYGEEAIAMEHKMILHENKAEIELIPYSEDISLLCRIDCPECDTNMLSYSEPIGISGSGILEIQPYRREKKYGELISIPFAEHQGINADVSYQTEYNQWYPAGGDKALVDGKLGTLNFRDGAWQGFWGDDLECGLELNGGSTAVSQVSANFYQYNNAWIFIPVQMQVEISNDGQNWQSAGIDTSKSDPQQRGKFIETLTVELSKAQQVQFIKVKVNNFGKVPDWHEAAGSDAWIFIDEIMVK